MSAADNACLILDLLDASFDAKSEGRKREAELMKKAAEILYKQDMDEGKVT